MPTTTFQRIVFGLSIAALTVLIVFIAANFRKVEIDFVVVEADIQLAFALILAALLGFVAGMVSHAFRHR